MNYIKTTSFKHNYKENKNHKDQIESPFPLIHSFLWFVPVKWKSILPSLTFCVSVCLCVRRAPGRNFRHRDLKFGISTRLGTSKKRFFGFFENVIFGGLGGLFGVKKVKIHHFSAKITKPPFHFCFLWSLCRVRMFLWTFHIFPHIMGGSWGWYTSKKEGNQEFSYLLSMVYTKCLNIILDIFE